MNENRAVTLRDVTKHVTDWIAPISGKEAEWLSNSLAAHRIAERIEDLFFKDVYPAAEARNLKIELNYSYDAAPSWYAFISLAPGHPGYDIVPRHRAFHRIEIFESHRKRKDVQSLDRKQKLCVTSISVTEHGPDFSYAEANGGEIPFEGLNAEQFVSVAQKQLMEVILFAHIGDAAKTMLDAIQSVGAEQVQKIIRASGILMKNSELTNSFLMSEVEKHIREHSVFNEDVLKRLYELDQWIAAGGYRDMK